jgi:hypothetical protein
LAVWKGLMRVPRIKGDGEPVDIDLKNGRVKDTVVVHHSNGQAVFIGNLIRHVDSMSSIVEEPYVLMHAS